MATFAVLYRYSLDSDALEANRQDHRDYLRSLYEAGTLTAVGRLGEGGPPSAWVVMNCPTREDVEQLLDQDPYHLRGLIIEREIRPWNVLYGAV